MQLLMTLVNLVNLSSAAFFLGLFQTFWLSHSHTLSVLKFPTPETLKASQFLWSPGCSQKKLALWVSGEFERRFPSSRCPLTQIQGCKENRELGWKIQEHRHLGVGWLKERTVKMFSPFLGGNRCFPYLLALQQSM